MKLSIEEIDVLTDILYVEKRNLADMRLSMFADLEKINKHEQILNNILGKLNVEYDFFQTRKEDNDNFL